MDNVTLAFLFLIAGAPLLMVTGLNAKKDSVMRAICFTILLFGFFTIFYFNPQL